MQRGVCYQNGKTPGARGPAFDNFHKRFVQQEHPSFGRAFLRKVMLIRAVSNIVRIDQSPEKLDHVLFRAPGFLCSTLLEASAKDSPYMYITANRVTGPLKTHLYATDYVSPQQRCDNRASGCRRVSVTQYVVPALRKEFFG
jgi:hypothetical protein